MKKVIEGKLYNTETADSLAEWGNGLCYTDFNFLSETLYRTKKGKFYLHGCGGARTRYSEAYGNCRGEGEDIVPLSEAEARKWVEEKFDGDKYIEIFGQPEEA